MMSPVFGICRVHIWIILILSLNLVESNIRRVKATSSEIPSTDNTDQSDRVNTTLIAIEASASVSSDIGNSLQVSSDPYLIIPDVNWTVPSDPLEFYPDAHSAEDDSDSGKESCLLDVTSLQMAWWIYPNGTLVDKLVRDAHVAVLDLSHLSINVNQIYEETRKQTKHVSADENLAFSVAGNGLRRVPFNVLALLTKSLMYLSLRGNDFSTPHFSLQRDYSDMSGAWRWAQFPVLDSLQELDLSNCSIHFLGSEIFANLTNLQGLYLSHNKIVHLNSDLFKNIVGIRKLDLSYIESANCLSSHIYDPSDDIYHSLNEGLSVSESVFTNLSRLMYLDVSHTKISPYSARAFTHLGRSLEFLSLCYTLIPLLSSGMFSQTELKVLDLSGNPTASLSIQENTFLGINDTLEILSFQNSRLHDMSWIRYLHNVEIVQLGKNNINVLHKTNFSNLKNLRLLDLSFNHIGNWFHRVFVDNTQLQLLNLRSNNINVLSTEMYRDFANLSFLAIGHNDFICNCDLRDLIDIAVNNVVLFNDSATTEKEDNQNSAEDLTLDRTLAQTILKDRIESRIVADFIPLLQKSHKHVLEVKKKRKPGTNSHRPNASAVHYTPSHSTAGYNPAATFHPVREEEESSEMCHVTMPDGELIDFLFVLLDYEPDNYWCYNSSTNTLHELAHLDPCDRSQPIMPLPLLNTTHLFIIGFAILAVALLLIIPLYLKWWYVKYFLIVLKRSAMMKFLNNDKRKDQTKPKSFTYDVFVSYCDRDRDWVLEELLPHLENNDDISICLHERDFQVGLSILENIIQCMDKSRCFLLVISKCFLSSQWCQFEMYLAQHRLFEAKKEHLILVMLEEIPRLKRPKSLQYLMQIKTYIKWPTDTEERKLFWMRLNRSISSIEHKSHEHDNESTV